MAPEKPNDAIMRAIHDMFNIQDEITVNLSGDLFIKGTGIRIGYFDGSVLFCENPVMRALRQRDFAIHEGIVDWNHEPQYDLRIHFNEDGTIMSISSNRMQLEVEWAKRRNQT